MKLSHCLAKASIRTSTLASTKDLIMGERTRGLSFLGNQKSCQILTNLPSPIHHRQPLKRTSRTCRILVHAYDADLEVLASMIVQLGKNLVLKTL